MYSTQGIILKKHDIGEADGLFTIYTKDFGKIRAVAHGIKKESAKLKGHLEPLSLASIQFIIGKNGERLTHAELQYFWPEIRQNPEALKGACYIAELFDRHCMPGERDRHLWRLLSTSFSELEKNGFSANLNLFLPSFEKSFLGYLGYEGEEDMTISGVRVARPW